MWRQPPLEFHPIRIALAFGVLGAVAMVFVVSRPNPFGVRIVETACAWNPARGAYVGTAEVENLSGTRKTVRLTIYGQFEGFEGVAGSSQEMIAEPKRVSHAETRFAPGPRVPPGLPCRAYVKVWQQKRATQ